MGVIDPTRTKTLRVQYSRQLVKLYTRFRVSIQQPIMDVLNRVSNPYIDIEHILDLYLAREVLHPVSPIISMNLRLGYRRGLRMAEGQLTRLQAEFTFVDEEALRLLEMNNLVLVKGVNGEMKKEMMRHLTDGLNNGWGIKKIVRSMNNPVETVGKHRATVIARTEVVRACNTAAMNRYKANGVEMWQWLSAIDPRTCEECARLDGSVYRWGDREIPPLHPQCRCNITPYK